MGDFSDLEVSGARCQITGCQLKRSMRSNFGQISSCQCHAAAPFTIDSSIESNVCPQLDEDPRCENHTKSVYCDANGVSNGPVSVSHRTHSAQDAAVHEQVCRAPASSAIGPERSKVKLYVSTFVTITSLSRCRLGIKLFTSAALCLLP
ncbi:unnamed protein product [Cercospora beticola]|nr:unnamed protein product [Cercospora beticola]